jgi:hypothetical protein
MFKILIMEIYKFLNTQVLKQLVFCLVKLKELSIPVIPLFRNVTLNNNVEFCPQILSGFVATNKQIHKKLRDF